MKRINKRRGFTLVEIMIVVLIIGILMAIAVPNFVNARTRSQTNSCIANLKEIDGATEQYAMDQHLATGAAVTIANLTGANSYLKAAPTCPTGGVYTVGPVGTLPTCSIGAPHVLP